MKRNTIQQAYQNILPDEEARERMLNNIILSSEISQVRKDERMMRKNMKPVVIAALIAVMVVLMGCAVAVLSLEDMKIGELVTRGQILDSNGNVLVEKEMNRRDVISLHGLADSPNNLAYDEWHAFRESYDPDKTIRDSLGDNYSLGDSYQDYDYYGCYTMEMVKKLDEICDKYDLSILRSITHVDSDFDELFKGLGIDSFFSGELDIDNDFDWAYFYQDGSFQVCADLMIMEEGTAWPNRVWYFMDRYMKSSISNHSNTVHLAGTIEDYEQWTYTTANGVPLLLALGYQDALIIAHQENSYVTIYITNATYGAVEYEGEIIAGTSMDRKALEAVADCFNFEVLS